MISGSYPLGSYNTQTARPFLSSQRGTGKASDVDTITASLFGTSATPELGTGQESNPLDLFGKFGQSVKALSLLSDSIASLTEKRQGLITSPQRAALDKELDAQKVEVERIANSDTFGNAAAVFQKVVEKLQRGDSRESIAASLSEHSDLLGSGFFKLLENAPATVFSAISRGLGGLKNLTNNRSISLEEYSKTLEDLIKGITSNLLGAVNPGQETIDRLPNVATQITPNESGLRTDFSRLHFVA